MSRRPFLSLFGAIFAVFWFGGVAWLYLRSASERRLAAFADALEQAGGRLPTASLPKETAFDRLLRQAAGYQRGANRRAVTVVDLREARDVDALLPGLPSCPDLVCIKLGPHLADPGGLAVVRRLPRLTDVVIDAPAADDAWFAQLAECRTLRRLAVRRGRVTDRTLELLARLPDLAVLTIPDAAVGDEGLAKLNGAPLQELDVRGSAATNGAIETLLRLPKLREVNLGRTAVTPEAIDRLRNERRVHVVR